MKRRPLGEWQLEVLQQKAPRRFWDTLHVIRQTLSGWDTGFGVVGTRERELLGLASCRLSSK